MSDDLVTFLAGEHDRARRPANQVGCPDDEQWALLADGLVDDQERGELLRHMAACATCRRRAGAILKEMPDAVLERLASGGLARESRIIRLRPVLLALAAGLTIAVGAGLWVYSRYQPGGPGNFGVDTTRLVLADASLTQLGYDLRGSATRADEKPMISQAEYEAAMAALQPQLEQPQPSPQALALATRAALSAGYREDALKYAQRWAAASPNDPAAHNACGLALFENNRYEQALAAFEHACRLAPDHLSHRLNAAMAADQAGLTDQAVIYFRSFIELDPSGKMVPEVQRRLKRLESK